LKVEGLRPGAVARAGMAKPKKMHGEVNCFAVPVYIIEPMFQKIKRENEDWRLLIFD
jgi:hypothetical protein